METAVSCYESTRWIFENSNLRSTRRHGRLPEKKTLSQQQQTLEKKEAESIVWETAIQVQQGVLAAKAQEFEEQLGRERIIQEEARRVSETAFQRQQDEFEAKKLEFKAEELAKATRLQEESVSLGLQKVALD